MTQFHDPWVAPALADGRLGRLEVFGRRSGASRWVHLGFVRRADDALLIGAGHPSSQWPANLAARPRCRFDILGRVGDYEAMELSGAERKRAFAALVKRYAEHAPRGRTFILRPIRHDEVA